MAKAKSTPRGDQFERDYLVRMGLVKPGVGAVSPEWNRALQVAAGGTLSAETVRQMMEGAALLLRVAKGDQRADAQAAARWLSGMGMALGMARTLLDTEARLIGGMGAVAPMATKAVGS